jgi:hypothetical protein
VIILIILGEQCKLWSSSWQYKHCPNKSANCTGFSVDFFNYGLFNECWMIGGQYRRGSFIFVWSKVHISAGKLALQADFS